MAFRHQDFFGGESVVSKQHLLQVHHHAAVAVGGQLTGGATDTGSAEVLDGFYDVLAEEFHAAFDEDLLGKRVANLDGGALGGASVVTECFTGQNGRATDTVTAGSSPKEDNLVSGAGGVG